MIIKNASRVRWQFSRFGFQLWSVLVSMSERAFFEKLVIEVSDPEKENPAIVDAIHAAGDRIQFVTEVNPSLEDVYLKLVRS